MGEGPATVPSLRHTRDSTHEAEFSGRGSSDVFSTALSLNSSAPAHGICSCSQGQSIPRLLLLATCISLILLGVQFLDEATLSDTLQWVRDNPGPGGLLFLVADVGAIVLMFPGAIAAMAAGALFGMLRGCLLVYLGTCLGQTLAFVLGRYLLRGVVMGYLTARWPKWALVDAALSNEGWKLITLLRLSPVVPWNVLNYALSVTGVGLLPYTLTSALAIIPWCITFTYFGTAARSMADILDGRAGPNGAMTAVFLSLSAVTLVSAIVFSTLIARRAVREALQRSSSPASSSDKELQALIVEGAPPSERLPSAKSSAFAVGSAHADTAAVVV